MRKAARYGLAVVCVCLLQFVSAVVLAADTGKTSSVTVKGFVLDSACAFTKGLTKPISRDCAISCANAGSPLLILADDGTIYWPIADTTPATGQNARLLPFAGQKVTVTGRDYQRGGSHAIVIDTIEPVPDAK
jgi:type 1 fimbria pilin